MFVPFFPNVFVNFFTFLFLIFNRCHSNILFFLPIQIHVLPTGIQYFADYLMTGSVPPPFSAAPACEVIPCSYYNTAVIIFSYKIKDYPWKDHLWEIMFKSTIFNNCLIFFTIHISHHPLRTLYIRSSTFITLCL